jgi:hypothetical protein
MSSASIPPLSFFLSKLIAVDNLISGISAYIEILQNELQDIDVYETPMLYIEKSDYYEKISTFLEILQNDSKRATESANESKGDAGAHADGKENRKVHKRANS